MANETSSAPIQNNEAPKEEKSEETQETSGQESSNQTPAAAVAKAEEQRYLRSLKLQVDGQEIDEELPFELPDVPEAKEWLTRQLQIGKMGQKRAQDYSNLEKEVASFIELLKTNPKQALRNPNIGVDMKKLVAEFLDEEIANSQKSPEQLEKEKLQQELEALKKDREKEKKDSEQRELARLTDLEFQKYDDNIDKALEKNADLPKSPYVVKKIAEYMLLGLQNNMDVSVEDVIPMVKDEIQNDIKEMFSAMPDEIVEQFLGKDRISKMRKKSVAAATAKQAPKSLDKIIPQSGNSGKKEEKPAQKMTYRQFFKI